jgi:hypothetical protein
MHRILIIAGSLSALLAGCGTPPTSMMSAPAAQEPLAWVRTDGMSGRANPALADQFAGDRTACGVTAMSDNAALRMAEACMNGRGYVLVPARQAEETAARFRGASGAQYSTIQ